MAPTSSALPSATTEMIAFEIAGQAFCVDIHSVREIRGWTPVTPVPHAAPAMMGVINLRGFVMPVIDLRQLLGFGVTIPTSRHVMIVGQDAGRVAGFLVDAVQEAFRIDVTLLQDPPCNFEGGGKLLDAMIPMDGRMLSRLVMASILPEPSTVAARAALGG